MQNKLALKSFFMGGYECADHINRSGQRINLQKETLHDEKILEDYKALKAIGIKVVREGACWSEIEIAPYTFDFSRLLNFFEAAEALDIQIIWDLCHFGYPNDLSPTHPVFTSRFVAYCEQFTIFHYKHCKHMPWIVPINEISFLSWHSGDMRGTVPFAVHSGWDIKYHLCKAAIMGIKAIKSILEDAVVLLVEPTLIDILGFNYYYNNQWTINHEILSWPDLENRLTPLSELLYKVSVRYNEYPLLIAETGHFGDLRAQWLNDIILECSKAIQLGVDLRGMCIYPVIDRPDWDDLSSYSNCGLWDFDIDFNRVPHKPSLEELLKGHETINYNLRFI